MASLTGIGLSGLNAAQAALLTTSHNITNANTDGYTRQKVYQGTQTPLFSGVGFFGQGTQIETVKRVYNSYLNSQVMAADTTRAQYETYANEIKQIDNLLADETAGLSPSLQQFFTGVQSVAANPSSIPARQTLLSAAESLTTRFHQLNTRLEDIRSGLEAQIKDSADLINSIAKEISSLNLQIVSAQAAGPGVPANDLHDKRDALISELNRQIKTSTTVEADGSISVFIGTGQPLVIGTTNYTLQATGSINDPKRLTMGLVQPGGNVIPLSEELLTGGTLGGLLQFRSEALDSAQNALGRIAMGVATAFNAQHAKGQDLNGVAGGNFFKDLPVSVQNLPDPVTGLPPAAQINAVVTSVGDITVSDYVLSFDGTNYELRSQPGNSVVYSGTTLPGPSATALGASTATVTVTPSATGVTGMASEYMLGFDGTTYSLTRQTDGVVVYSGATPPTTVEGLNLSVVGASAGDQILIKPGVEGLSISLASGTINAGDRFLIQPTRYAAQNIAVALSDTRLVAAAAPFRTAAESTNTGNGQISQGATMAASGFDTNGDSIADFGPITLTFNAAGNFTVMNGATALTLMPNNSYSPATDGAGKTFEINIPGQPRVSFQISGTPQAGDVFTISPNLTPPAVIGGAATNVGVSDSRNMVALGGLQSAKTLLGGSASYQYAYSQIVSSIGAKAREVEVGAESQTALYNQAVTAQQSLSGVNIDEEASNLIRYQQAYQASARVIDVAGRLFDEILSVSR